MEGFAVGSIREGSAGRLIPCGELDVATVPILEEEFHDVHRDAAVEVIAVDLSRLTFMDSSGIHLLERMSDLRERGRSLRIIRGSRAADRIIDLAGMAERFSIIAGGDDPLAPVGDG